MKRKYTEEQRQAFSSLGGTVLVSAAAGSGKTSVLVERIIRIITDAKAPIDADRLLVVTFTNAAANEMKDRISSAISGLIEENPNNIRLKRQQELLNNANISTVDSFCAEILRENFYKIGLSPKFRVADEKELLLIKNEAMMAVLLKLYEDDNKKFANLAELFNYGRDDRRLQETIEKIYDYTRSHPFPEKWFDEKLKMYTDAKEVRATQWGALILKIADQTVEVSLELIDEAFVVAQKDETIYAAYTPALAKYKEYLCTMKNAVQRGDWNSIFEHLNSGVGARFKRASKCRDMSVKQKVTSNRDLVRKNLDDLRRLFVADENQCIEDIKKLAPVVGELFSTVKLYTKKFNEIKRERNVLDFSDLLHLSLTLLVNPICGGYEITDFAKSLRGSFDVIMVDEYQDINEAQEMLFKALSKNEGNMFVVGDAKQSIYRFRQANPKIFLGKGEGFDKYNAVSDNYPSKIYLTKNFRSRKGIIDFTNFIFSTIMSKEAGDIDYNEDEALNFGAQYYDNKQDADVELDIISVDSMPEEDSDILEARYIAKRIKEMTASETVFEDGRKRNLQFSDFCILLRSAKTHAQTIKKELENQMIPAISESERTFFKAAEISVMLSLLRVIDNPLQDIPLISALLSPVFAFSVDDLAKIRMNSPNESIYLALKHTSEQEGTLASRCLEFLHTIENFRVMAATTPSDKLINYVLEETSYSAIVQAMPNPQMRVLNLRMLLEYAREYERAGFKGLNGFIRFIDRLNEQKEDLSPATALSKRANAVRIMSIHKSKGLEFPVCIIANLSRKFPPQRGDIDLNDELGVGVHVRDRGKAMLRYTTLPKEAVRRKEKLSDLSEELRVLYVAMTRAREKLILISSLDEPRRVIQGLASKLTDSSKISPYFVSSATSLSDFILMCAIRHKDAGILREIGEVPFSKVIHSQENLRVNMVYSVPAEAPETPECYPEVDVKGNKEIIAEIQKRLQYEYPYAAATKTPSKITASEATHKDTVSDILTTPAFMKEEKLTPAQRGTAIHRFMEFADYEEAKTDIVVHLDDLVNKGFLTQQQKEAVDIVKLKRFFNSELYDRINRSSKVYRELLFTVAVDASSIDSDFSSEDTILQGAVDCAFEENGGVVIVDYKTDRIQDVSMLKERYGTQVKLYKRALAGTLGKDVKECILYSLYLNEEIKL